VFGRAKHWLKTNQENKMKRRDVIKKGLIGAGSVAAATTISAPAIASNRVEITMVSTWPRDFPGLGTGAQRFAQRLSDLSDGRITVKYFSAVSASALSMYSMK
jgi:TRAP-type mannitol/chloroaromatic compound transport system substrate-binding protein